MVYDVGDTVPLRVVIRDDAGVPCDAASVTLTVSRPDGVVDHPTPVRVATGDYRYDYVADVPGMFGVGWASTGPASAFRDQFSVADPDRVYPISLGQVKAWLGLETETHDEVVRSLIEQCCDIGESYTGAVFGRRTVVLAVRGTGGGELTVPVLPMFSDPAVTVDGDVWTVGTDFVARPGSGVLVASGVWPLGADVRVSYVAGYVEQPGRHVTGLQALIQHVWRASKGTIRPGSPVDEFLPFGIGYYVRDFWDLGRMTGFA